jgi:fused signal recognition particle receptor
VTLGWPEFFGDAPVAEVEESRRGVLRRLRSGLTRSRTALTERIAAIRFDPEDAETWQELEEALILADVGVQAAGELVQRLGRRRRIDDLGAALTEEVAGLFGPPPRLLLAEKPAVILVVGVNGTGKTTTVGKLAHSLTASGRSVLIGAADTFRAAAEEQLEVWAKRAGADFVGSNRGQDPASVAFDAVEAGIARGRDVVIIDTAGRLHTQANLIEELVKVRRVIERRLPGAPHETLLVLDAMTGQNGIQQARVFSEAVQVTGVALTKLDGTAKGGIVIPIAYDLGLPVKLIGVGEALEDLRPFDAGDFARALVGMAPDGE